MKTAAPVAGVPASGVSGAGVSLAGGASGRAWLAAAGDAVGQVVVPEQFESEVEAQRFIADLDRLAARTAAVDRKSTRLNSSHSGESRMPSSA